MTLLHDQCSGRAGDLISLIGRTTHIRCAAPCSPSQPVNATVRKSACAIWSGDTLMLQRPCFNALCLTSTLTPDFVMTSHANLLRPIAFAPTPLYFNA